MNLKPILNYINQISYLGSELNNLEVRVKKMNEEIVFLSEQIGEVELDGKLEEQQKVYQDLDTNIQESYDDVSAMTELVGQLEEVVSEDDDVTTVKNLTEIISIQKNKLNDIKNSHYNTKPLLEFATEYYTSFGDSKLTLENKVYLGQNIQIIDNQLESQQKEFNSVSSVVKQCDKKFNDFNVRDKYARREEELKYGQELVP